ncbi:hypothetical protein J4Q44_G00009200 [Coregonus suidteri]|uniref:Uncharacterized protein n=1 Tax=Coregonus suidteri TaxID=861788 RepID=A0AAN8RID7_9TELE
MSIEKRLWAVGQNNSAEEKLRFAGATEDMMYDVEKDPEDPDAFLITSPPWRFPEFEDLIASADRRWVKRAYGEKKHSITGLYEFWLPLIAEKVLLFPRKEKKASNLFPDSEETLTPDARGDVALKVIPAILPLSPYRVEGKTFRPHL